VTSACRRTALFLLSLPLALATPAAARDLGPVPATFTVEGHLLQLNGAGLRVRYFVEVYLGALYLERRSDDPAAILAADGPWAVTMLFRRDVGQERILDAFVSALELNSPGQLEGLRPQLEVLHAILEDVKEGQALQLHYLPGAGTTLTVPGGSSATVPGRPFGEAMLRTWIGEHPADRRLKDALLGR
jgi:hypothetical protein